MLDDYYDVELKCEEPITIDGFDAEIAPISRTWT